MDKTISIIRYPDELKAIVIKPVHKIPKDPYGLLKIELDDFYQVVEKPLDKDKSIMPENIIKLIKSWEYLKDIRQPDAKTLFNILVVLIETGPVCTQFRPQIKLPDLDYKKPEFKPTALHPRQYKGLRPPKPGRFPKTDLRPFLCDKNLLKRILDKLSPKLNAALKLLEKAGYDISPFLKVKNRKQALAEPYYLFHFKLKTGAKPYKLPDMFVKYILPSLKGLKWDRVICFLRIYWNLSLNKNRKLLIAVSKLISMNNSRNTAIWCGLITCLPKSRRVIFATLMVECEGYKLKTRKLTADNLIRLTTIVRKRHYPQRLIELFAGMKKNVSFDYLFAGFKLANKYMFNYSFYYRMGEVDACFPHKAVERIIHHVKDQPDYFSRLPFKIWEHCGNFEGFSEMFICIAWKKIKPETAFNYLRCYMYFYDTDLSDDVIKKKWKYILSQTDIIEETLKTIDKEYQNKFVCLLRKFLWFWDYPERLKKYMSSVYTLLKIISQEPFTKKSNSAATASHFIDQGDQAVCDFFLQAPVSSFLNLEKACRSENRARLISRGIYSMLREIGQFTVECFYYFSSKLFDVAKVLGTLSEPRRHNILQKFMQHQIMDKNLALIDIHDLYQAIQDDLGEGVSNPFSRKLQKYIAGECDMSEQRIKRHTSNLLIKLILMRLDILDKIIFDTLRANYTLDNKKFPQEAHTLQAINMLEDNKRSFKRFFKAYLDGNRTYIQTHPSTRSWTEKHRKINLKLWTQGIILSKEHEDLGLLTIEIEQNPFEALKMGTYVGSCLGLGGEFTFSAAAVVLDINKQVLFARDKRNSFVARQLIAISEEEKLVCYEIYPANTKSKIKKMFAEYDRLFAKELGIELYEDIDDEYTINHILSKDWWDDYAWDLSVK